MSESRQSISFLSDIHEVALYLQRVGARPRSFKDAVIEYKSGNYYKEVSVIRFTELGDILAEEQFAPTDGEREAIKEAFTKYKFPKPICVDALVDLPNELKSARSEDVYIFHNERGQIEMLQQRIDTLQGKDYKPWTPWDDGRWRMQEHGGKLPLWGLNQLKDHVIIFLHEGAKPARAMIDKIKQKHCDFPWIDEFRHAAHLGWIGGAPNPHRTNWDLINKHNPKRVYIVADNDMQGKHAIPKIAKELNCPVFSIQFDQSFKEGFDVADSFPEDLFEGPERAYKGPAFTTMLHPATWATDKQVIPPVGRGRPTTVHTIRPHFAEQWCWIESVKRFVCVEFPFLILEPDQFNVRMASFSHTKNTADLVHSFYTGDNIRLTYRPDKPVQFVTDDETSALNVYRPPNLKPNLNGSADMFLKFMEYFIPDEEERKQVLRWIATLIARPQIKIMYGLIMMSEIQGIGKSLLGDYILAPLIGRTNCSWPNENMIVGQQFNGWLANKRLVLVNEIYSGHNWQAYNKLKTTITDPAIEVNVKHMATYTIENWAHFYVCSNSMIPLKIDDKDRRWYIPQLTEKPWSLEKFTALHAWLRGGGLEKIYAWALNFGDYIRPGAEAPMSASKFRLIDESRSEPERLIYQLGKYMAEQSDRNIAFTISQIRSWLVARFDEKVWETPQRISNILKSIEGLSVSEEIKFKGREHKFVVNNKEILENTPGRIEKLDRALANPGDLILDGDEF